MNDHPSREELSAFDCGDLPARRAHDVILHLLQPCESCLAQASRPLRSLLQACETAVRRAIRQTLREERNVRKEQRQAVDLLQGMGKLRRMSRLNKMELLLDRSWAMRHESPALMIEYATLASWCADGLNARRYGQRVWDFRCRAHAELGNALRVGQQLPRASAELAHARGLFELGTGDRFLEVRLVELEATLAADLRNFPLAANNLLQVYEFYSREGDHHMAGRALIKRGLYTGYAGEPAEGLRLLGEGLALVDESRDPSLVHAAVHNQLLFLVDTGQFKEATRFRLRESRRLAQTHGRVNEIKIRHLESRTDAGLGKHARAEAIFREVKQRYTEVGLPGDAAITGLELAASLLALGMATEAREVTEEAAETFNALQIEREVLMAVLMLRHAFRAEKATVELVQYVVAFLRRAENDPNARFEPELW